MSSRGYKVKIYRGDILIREGEARQTDFMNAPETSKYFGFTIKDLIQLGVYFVMIVIFLVKTDNRISKIEELQAQQAIIIKDITLFRENSDNWHASVTAVSFHNGKPDFQVDNSKARQLFQNNSTPTNQ